MILVKTPLRVSFFGGGTDFPEFFNSHEGIVIGSTIDKFIYHTVSYYSKELFENSIRFSYSKIEYAKNINKIAHRPFKAILKHYQQKNSIEVNLASDLPSFSGMGSSSSFTVGLINGLVNFQNKKELTKKQLAQAAINIERNILKECVGYQDQIFASFGGFNEIRFKNNDFIVSKINISSARADKLNDSLVLVYTGIKRKAHDVEKQKFRKLNSKKIDALKEIRDVANEALNLLYSKKNIDKFGELLHHSWDKKKLLSKFVSNPIIDELYEIGLRNGAIGGKLLGAGGGGFILFYVPKNKRYLFIEKLKRFYILNFNFSSNGSSIINRG